MFKVMAGDAGTSAMFKVMGGGARSVSHVQGDGRGQGASAMYKVMGGG